MVKRGNIVDRRLINLFRLGFRDDKNKLLKSQEILEEKRKKHEEEVAHVNQLYDESLVSAESPEVLDKSNELNFETKEDMLTPCKIKYRRRSSKIWTPFEVKDSQRKN